MGTYEHLRYEPYSFGVCEERSFTAKVKSPAWEVEEQRVVMLGRREGEELKIYIPKFQGMCKTGVEIQCSVEIDLSDYVDIFFDMNYAFAVSLMFYNVDLESTIVIPAAAKLGIAENKTILSLLPTKGTLFNENRFTVNQEVLFGVMDATIILNTNLFDMGIDAAVDYEENEEMSDDEQSD